MAVLKRCMVAGGREGEGMWWKEERRKVWCGGRWKERKVLCKCARE